MNNVLILLSKVGQGYVVSFQPFAIMGHSIAVRHASTSSNIEGQSPFYARGGKGSVLFVCRNFNRMAGGVERMAIGMMNELVCREWRVGLLTWDPEDAEAHYALDDRITWNKMAIGDPSARASWLTRWRRLRHIRRTVRRFRPGIMIGFQSGTFLAARVAALGLGIPVIAAERNSPDQYDYVSHGGRRRMLAAVGLALATRITVQLPSYRYKYPAVLRPRILAIPNPVARVPGPPYPNESGAPPRMILSLGRLSYQKNQAFLLRAFARVSGDYPDWRLALVGDGEAAEALQQLAQELAIFDRVEFAGATRDIGTWFSRSAFLALPSLWEGFPNALMEAFAHGVPAVGFRSTAGINELLVDGETGLLTRPDEEAFAAAMRWLIDRPEARRAMGRAGVRTAAQYEPAAVYDRWEALLLSLTGEGTTHGTAGAGCDGQI